MYVVNKDYYSWYCNSYGRESFSDCTSLITIYYTGIQEQWDAISISSGNDKLENVNIVYGYETQALRK